MTAGLPGSIAADVGKVGQRGAVEGWWGGGDSDSPSKAAAAETRGTRNSVMVSLVTFLAAPSPNITPPVHWEVQDDKEPPIKSRFIDCEGHESGFMVVPQRWDRFTF